MDTADELVWARDLLVNPRLGRRRLVGADLREALVDLHEFWLAGHAARAGLTASGDAALVAVGALGRRELVPYADLDLLLVHEAADGIDATAHRLWYPLWNAGIGLDHAVRTVRESLRVAGEDPRVLFGLLEGRLVAGRADIVQRLAAGARQSWRATTRSRLDDLVAEAADRWARAGEVAQRAEPDLKHGRGGLRDLRLLDALAAAQLVDRPGPDVVEARAVLLDVRTELRRVVGRARDVLRAQDGDDVAAALGMADRFALAGALSSAGRSVGYALDVAIRTVRAATARRTLVPGLRRGPERRPLAEGVVLHGAEVALARDAAPEHDPALPLRLAAAAARAGAPVAAGTMATLVERAPDLPEPWPKPAADALFGLLAAGPGLVDVVEAFDRTGLWGRLFPEWTAVRDLLPRDSIHLWTVDRHLIQATVRAAGLVTAVDRPDLLLLGALLHDIGKGRGTDHSVAGAALAARVGARIGLSDPDIATLAAMVRHHLLLPHTVSRHDVTDPATVRRVVDTLGGDRVLLDLLAALTEADGAATGPGVWTPWRASLVAQLVAACRAVLAGGPPPGPEPLAPEQIALAESVAAAGRPGLLMSGPAATATVTIVAPDRAGLLARAAGVLALHSLDVHSATMGGHGGVAVDVFGVSPRFGSLPDPALLREQLGRAIDGSLPLAAKLAAKERDYARSTGERAPPRVRWFAAESSGAVVLELHASDRIGLLHRVAAALEAGGADVRWARLATPGATVIASFCLHIPDEPAARGRIAAAVLAAC